MPELPEVETTVNDLRKKLVGLKFKDVWTDPAKPTHVGRGASWPLIKKVIKNKKILDIRRRAKFIIIDIEGAYSIFIHQKISGHLLYGIWTLEHGIWKSKAKGPLKDELSLKELLFVENKSGSGKLTAEGYKTLLEKVSVLINNGSDFETCHSSDSVMVFP